MKIAQVAPIWYKIPPAKYGGTESVISNLTEELVRKGYDVTLFATGDSQTNAKLVSTHEKGLIEEGYTFYTHFYHPLLHFYNALEKKDEYDIIHFHFTSRFDYMFMGLLKGVEKALFTLHAPLPNLSDKTGKYELLAKHFADIPLVSISDNQRDKLPLNFVSTVYNGIDTDFYKPSGQTPQKKLLYLSRISSEKGTYEAVQAALRTGRELILAGNVNTLMDRDVAYNKEKIEPLLSNSQVEAVGEVYGTGKLQYFQNNYAFLFPTQWEEPFGLVLVEAMACGTPVIAFAKGSIPEIVKDGETGFIVNSSDEDIRGEFKVKKTGIDGLCEAVEKLYSLSAEDYAKMRESARKRVEEYFTLSKMTDGYLETYGKISGRM